MRRIRRAVAVLATASFVLGLTLTSTSKAAAATSPAWLSEVNRFRTASALSAVVEQPAWSSGIDAHLRYLGLTPSSYRTGQCESAHTENPASPYYTQAGADAGESSDLLEGSGFDDVGAIDSWLTAPFHAIGILRPGLTHVAFASNQYGAGLDVIRGLDGDPTITEPILFAGRNSTFKFRSFGGESPDPTETCGYPGNGGFGLPEPIGIPLIAMLPDTRLLTSARS